MRALRALCLRLAEFFQKTRRDREFADELESHLQMHIADNLRSGMNPTAARRNALIKLGGIEQAMERYRHQRGLPFLEALLKDLRFGCRLLRKSPGFTIVTVLTLALGIGANTAMFSVIDAVLLSRLPFANSNRLVWVWGNFGNFGGMSGAVSPPDFLDYRAQNRSFDNLSAFYFGDPDNLSINGQSEQVRGAMVSSGFFETLDAKPLLGSTFTPTDEKVALPETTILSYRLWQQRFGADRNVLGRTVNFNGGNTTIIGVMPASFDYPPQTEIWFPTPMLKAGMQQRSAQFLRPIGSLKAGVSLAQAQSDLDAIASQLSEQYPSSDNGWKLRLESMQDAIVGSIRSPLLLLFGAVGLVLLIACANVASLLLALNSTRQKEIAIRTTLGAGSGRIAIQLVTESVMLGLVGGTIGLFLAAWGTQLLRSFGPATIPLLPRSDTTPFNAGVLAFTAALSIITGILFGLAPVLQARKTNVQYSLKENERSSTGTDRQRLRGALVMSEVMFSVALLVGAGLLLNSLWRMMRVEPGFDSKGVLTAQLVLPTTTYAEEDRRIAFFRDFMARLQALPGVESAGGTNELPLSGQDNDDYFTMASAPPKVPQEANVANLRVIAGGYFQAMRMPLLEGRLFSEQDQRRSQQVVVVDEPFVRRYFPNGDPIGKHLLIYQGPSGFLGREIIGVVGGTRDSALRLPPEPTMYVPYSQMPNLSMSIAVRSAGDPEQHASSIRAALASVDSDEPLSAFQTMQDVVSASAVSNRIQALLLGLFGTIALTLAAAGIYGLISYTVAQKTHEIGIRLALGAEPTGILRLVFLRGMKLVMVGMVLGLALAAGLTQLMASELYGVKATDPITFAAAIVVLGPIALLACYIPARRATKVDPMVALRYE